MIRVNVPLQISRGIFVHGEIIRLVHGNVIPMGITCETSHGMGQHTFVFPM